MFSFFKKKGPAPTELTFKARVEGFWKWFEGEAQRIYAMIDAKQHQTLADEMSAKVEELGLGAWVLPQ